MGAANRRQTLGLFASAALPAIWSAVTRRGWSHADLQRAVEVSSAQMSRLMYGDRRAGRRTAVLIQEIFPEVRLALWDEPCPKGWRPHAHRKSKSLPPTGTD